MTARVAYVRGFFRDRDVEGAIGEGRHPYQEHTLFLERNHVAYFSYDDVAKAHREVVQALTEQGLLEWGIASLLAEREPYDTILASGEDVGLPIALSSHLRGSRERILIIAHGFLSRSAVVVRRLRAMENVSYLCLSDQIRRMIVEEMGVCPSHVFNTGWGVDTNFFRPVSNGFVNSPHIVSAGIANRDYATLLRAAAPLGVRVSIAADSAQSRTAHTIRSEDLPPQTVMRSWGTYTNLRDLYASASVVVVPLYPAPFACGYTVIAEAMAMGKPVIATRTSAHSDLIVDGECGLYVRPGDARDLREKIQFLLDNPWVVQRYGERARARVQTMFSHDAFCHRLETVIRSNEGADIASRQSVSHELA